MSHPRQELQLCTCNGTVRLDANALRNSLHSDSAPSIACSLCRQDATRITDALARNSDIVVGCTQEKALFAELAQDAGFDGRLRFVNLRETAGWSVEAAQAQPKIAALLAAAQLPDPQPVPGVTLHSDGVLLIVGPMEVAIAWAEQLKDQMDVSVLATGMARGGELPYRREYPVYSGNLVKIKGYLGSFKVAWEQSNPIDVELCTRCNACVRACPEHAIGFDYQVDAAKCRSHRSCVSVCPVPGALDFDRVERGREATADLVLDLSAEPCIRLPHPPTGYLAPGRDPLDQARAVQQLCALVGEFEKPKYFVYKANVCAHSRNRITGCTQCIDVCSTAAIAPAGDRVEVDAHLCMGCGGCATTCPSGAMRYAYPSVPDLGLRLKSMLATYRRAGGADACLLFHDAKLGADHILELGRRGRGLPARVIPVEVHDIASIGLDVLLGAYAYGASQCVILYQSDEPEGYVENLGRQLKYGATILQALGYGDGQLGLLKADEWRELDEGIWALQPAGVVAQPAAFHLTDEKRRSLEFVFQHLVQHAPQPVEEIELPNGSPWGAVVADKQKCTLCMSCVGACPESALMDTPDFPRLKFLERNCVQCGLCVKTCPEGALSLAPRLLLTEEVPRERVLNEAEPFECVRCGKAFGTRQMIESMLGRLAGHAMFANEAARKRLQMCADCRVIDMMEHKNEASIFDF